MAQIERIMIFGGSGSGKSTLARQVGGITGLPVIHIDPMYWNPGWEQKPAEETTALVRAAMGQGAWVFEGNHGATLDERAALADLIIYLDMPLRVRLWRFTRRWWRYRKGGRPDLPPDTPDRWDPAFVWDFIIRYGGTRRARALRLLDEWRAQGRAVRVLRSPARVRRFLADLESSAGA